MAADIAEAMNALSIESAFVLGAQGGMIAQHLTLDFPEKVKKLVLAVMADQSTSLLEKRVKNWLLLAREGIIQNRCWI
ncbi:3-oxoadipate enol-lactone hydrolase/4-carboxymuconolactone decarboxylase [Streptococcus constellatus]|nr:3-oxoadipate enol-lactone hydrolase/4-carboxymuconolactone decarboxylase [Streptococcus constellatus]